MIKNGKMLTALFAVALCAAFCGGCIQTQQSIAVDENGMAMVSFCAIADKVMAGDELNQFAWQIQRLIPELNTNYDLTSYTFEEGYSEYLVYQWVAKDEIPVTNIKGVSWSADDGTYEFRVTLDPILDVEKLTEDNRNDVVMEISLMMPDHISMTNTPYVDENTCRWVITKEMLTKDIVLWATTG